MFFFAAVAAVFFAAAAAAVVAAFFAKPAAASSESVFAEKVCPLGKEHSAPELVGSMCALGRVLMSQIASLA